MPLKTSKLSTEEPHSGARMGAIRAAIGASFIAAALYEAVSVWIGGSSQQWVQWLFPIVGAVLGYEASRIYDDKSGPKHDIK
jgi:hypothetical protein